MVPFAVTPRGENGVMADHIVTSAPRVLRTGGARTLPMWDIGQVVNFVDDDGVTRPYRITRVQPIELRQVEYWGVPA